MTLASEWQLVNDAFFRGKVQMAIMHECMEIFMENPGTPARREFSSNLYLNPASYLQPILLIVSSDSVVSAAGSNNVTDADILRATRDAIEFIMGQA